MKAISVVITLLFVMAAGQSLAHHGRLQDHTLRATLLSYGLYGTGSAAFLRQTAHAPGSPEGIKLIEQTTVVPGVAGARFGFCVQVTGALEDGELDLDKVVRHPPTFLADGSVSTGYAHEIELMAKDGEATACLGHTFQGEADAVPGKWTIALMAADQVVVSRIFEVR
ncbi:MAG: DUF3859 domain-containing protein [Burkholderiales bacterium]